MTEGSLIQHDVPMCVRVWLEVGYNCERRQSSHGQSFLDWSIWVRGVRGHDISTFVHKVVFYLEPSSAFVYPKRVLSEPPYEIQESSNSGLEVPIEVHLKYSEEIISIKLKLEIDSTSIISSETKEWRYDCRNPVKNLLDQIMKAGGEIRGRTSSSKSREHSTKCKTKDESRHGSKDSITNGKDKTLKEKRTDSNSRSDKRTENTRRSSSSKSVREKREKKIYKVVTDLCSKCNGSSLVDLKKYLLHEGMTKEEVSIVTNLHIAYNNYEKSSDAITLPPMSDPIFNYPELPASLKALKQTATTLIDPMLD